MLSVKAIDTKENELFLGTPLKVTLSCDEDVPADSIELELSDVGLGELKCVEVSKGGKVIFAGEVDEQTDELSEFPKTVIVARSSAAILIDNEAYPMSLEHPSAMDVFRFFAEPFGFRKLCGEDKELDGKLTVAKGTSCFNVLKAFSKDVYGAFPRCEGDILYIGGKKTEGKLRLGFDEIPLVSLKVTRLRCNRISEVMVKLSDNEGYVRKVSNLKAKAEGVAKVRYLNASSGSSKTLADADRMIKESQRNSFCAVAVCWGCFADALGMEATVKGIEQEQVVSAVKYTFGKNGEYTRLTLRRKEF